MTLAGILFLVAVVAAFAIFMALLAYGLIVAGDSAETAVPAAAGGAAAANESPLAAPAARPRAAKAERRKAAALEDAA